MIGDDDLDPQRAGSIHALMAADAIVDGDDDVGLSRRGEVHDTGRQAVAELETVGNEIGHVAQAHGPHRAHHQGRGSGAVGVEVAHDQHARLSLVRVGQEFGRGRGTAETADREQVAHCHAHFMRRDIARGIDPAQQRAHPARQGRVHVCRNLAATNRRIPNDRARLHGYPAAGVAP